MALVVAITAGVGTKRLTKMCVVKRFFYAEGFPEATITFQDRKVRVGFSASSRIWMTVAFHDTFKAEDLVPLWKEKTITSKAPYSSSVTMSSSFWRISFIVTVIAVADSNGGARIFLHECLLTTRSYNLPGSVFR
jgi:hypothetical protein